MRPDARRRAILAALSVLPMLGARPARAQGDKWPSRPIKLLCGFPPGGGADAMARLIGLRLGDQLGQPVIVENKTGATGTICSEAVARAAPDGYTLQLAHINSNTIGPILVSKDRFDAVNDFTPIALLGITPQMLCHHPKHKFGSVPALIRYAKDNPGKLTYASSGVGSIQHIAGEAFNFQAETKMLHVPFKGTGEAMAALISGDVDLTFSSTGSALPQVQGGKLALLAMCTPRRLAKLPDVPTVAETLKGYEISTWYGLAGPAKLPPAIVERLDREVHLALGQPAVVKRLGELDAEIVSQGTPAQFAQFWKDQIVKYRRIIADAKIEAA